MHSFDQSGLPAGLYLLDLFVVRGEDFSIRKLLVQSFITELYIFQLNQDIASDMVPIVV